MQKPIEELHDLEISFQEDFDKLNQGEVALKDTLQLQQHFRELEQKYLGETAKLSKILANIRKLEPDARKEVGRSANLLRVKIESRLAKEKEKELHRILRDQLELEAVDATRSGIRQDSKLGGLHLATQVSRQIEDIFMSMGFEVEYAKEIDNAYNTFDALNIPETHPARDSWDTLWFSDGNLAIPHTSAMQNRIMKAGEVPLRKIVIGKSFRNEATDARHEHTFMQVEGICIQPQISMSEMLGTLLEFMEKFFGAKLDYKFTPDYFPFVEPGGQLAIAFAAKDNSGKLVGNADGFLEVLGCGMIHPKVLAEGGIDPEKYQGFAWGFGLERLALIKYGINDLRHFYSGDLRFVRQFI